MPFWLDSDQFGRVAFTMIANKMAAHFAAGWTIGWKALPTVMKCPWLRMPMQIHVSDNLHESFLSAMDNSSQLQTAAYVTGELYFIVLSVLGHIELFFPPLFSIAIIMARQKHLNSSNEQMLHKIYKNTSMRVAFSLFFALITFSIF